MIKVERARRDSASGIETGLESSGALGLPSLPAVIGFGVLCLLLLAAPFYFSGLWQAEIDALGGGALVPQMEFLSLSVGACFLLALAGLKPAPRSTLARLIAAFLGWCALSIIGSVYLHDSAIELSRLAALAAWFFMAGTLLGSENEPDAAARRLWLLGAIVLGADVVAGIALQNFFFSTDPDFKHNPRQFSTFFNPNLLANYCALALPLTLALLAKARRNRALLLFAALSLPLILSGLVLTSSKGGFLSALVALLVFCVAAWRARKHRIAAILQARRRLFVVPALLLFLLGGVLLQKTLLPRLQAARSGEDNSTMFRAYTWRGTLRMAEARPLLGWGPGSYPTAYPQFAITGYTRTAHQVWLQLAAESGFPAALLLLAACGTGAFYGWRALKNDGDWASGAGAMGTVAAFTTHGCTDSGWSITSIALLLVTALALLDSLNSNRQSPIVNRQSSISYRWVFLAVFFALLTAGTRRMVSGEDVAEKARDLLVKGAPEMALQTAREATEIDRFNARLWHKLGRIEQATGQGASAAHNANVAFFRASELQPTKASHYLHMAQAQQKLGNMQKEAALYATAVALDANDTGTRLARAEYFMSLPDAKSQELAWRDYEYVAALADAPYGKYPAIAEMVNLDFPRAFLKLGERALTAKNKAGAQKYAARGLEFIARWHANEMRNRRIAQGDNGAQFAQETGQVADLETQLNALKEQSK